MTAAGGKCVGCGYSRSLRSLSFHHVDPKLKKFQISSRSNSTREKVEAEIKKCVLVCQNCHAEIHDGLKKVVGELGAYVVVDSDQ